MTLFSAFFRRPVAGRISAGQRVVQAVPVAVVVLQVVGVLDQRQCPRGHQHADRLPARARVVALAERPAGTGLAPGPQPARIVRMQEPGGAGARTVGTHLLQPGMVLVIQPAALPLSLGRLKLVYVMLRYLPALALTRLPFAS